MSADKIPIVAEIHKQSVEVPFHGKSKRSNITTVFFSIVKII
jgi:hypothetical protein